MQKKKYSIYNNFSFSNLSLFSIIQVFLSIFIIVFLLKSCVIEFYKVESASMESELFEGEIVVLSRVAYFFGLPTRLPIFGINLSPYLRYYYRDLKLGDVIIIDGLVAQNINNKKFIIKRITGLPGDSVGIEENSFGLRYHLQKSSVNNSFPLIQIPHQNDKIIIDKNNFFQYENILINECDDFNSIKNMIFANSDYKYRLKIKNDYFFVQGDNSNVSYDSRAFGLIPQKSIIGKGLIRFLSNKKRKDKSIIKLI